MKLDLEGKEDYDYFSEKFEQSDFSNMQVDNDDQVKSELDSSFIQSDSDFSEDLLKPVKHVSGFSTFKKDNRRTADISHEESDDESEEGKNNAPVKVEEVEKPVFPPKPQKKRRRRRDVVFKKILRECRRYFQTHLCDLTGFVASKKPRKDDYIYKCMERFNIEYLKKEGTFFENFYLACLLYPQDLSRNIDIFIAKKEEPTKEKHKEYKGLVAKIHDTLYKYSHDKLEFFVSKPELSDLFMHFYNNGAENIKKDLKLVEELEHIRKKCEESYLCSQ